MGERRVLRRLFPPHAGLWACARTDLVVVGPLEGVVRIAVGVGEGSLAAALLQQDRANQLLEWRALQGRELDGP
eukprot:scaffold3768_cov376-Prasinococcus_capsulatus_cf.AAC.21